MSGFATNGLSLATAGLTGAELLAADTQNAQGLFPETVAVSTAQLASFTANGSNFRNLLHGGDFTTNPWQRGTSTTSSISSTLTYQADRWFALGGATSAIIMQRTATTTVPGFSQALTVKRVSATSDTLAITVGQILESADSIVAQGQPVVLSFWAACSANYSPTNSALGVSIYSGTGTDQSAASLAAATLTGNTLCNATAQGVTNAISSVSLSTTMQRFFVLGKVPSTASQIGVLFTMTPVGTASGAPTLADSFQLIGVQLEVAAGLGAGATNQSTASAYASPFEHTGIGATLSRCLRYAYQINEPTIGAVVGTGLASTAAIGLVQVPIPVVLRAVPTVTTSIGGFKITNGAGTAQTVTTLAAGAMGTTPYCIGLSAYTSGTLTVGQGALLVGANSAGSILASADL